MSKDNLNLIEIVQNIARGNDGKNLDEAVKEASTEEEVTTDEEKVTTDEEKATTEEGDIDYDKLASQVADIMKEKQLDKVASLVEKLNKEAEELSGPQQDIVTGIFNATCIESGEVNTEDIVKMGEENSSVPHIVDMIYKYAETADSLLAEEYGVEEDSYNTEDVVKLATTLIGSVDNPFNLETEKEEETEKEATEEVDEMDVLADKVVEKLISKTNKE